MPWKIEFSRSAEKDLSRIDKHEALRLIKYLDDIAVLENPRLKGKGLTSTLAGLWRYRVGDMRILCKIEDNKLLVLVVQIGHRSTVYS